MRVAIVHSFYSSASPSGENAAVISAARMLAEAGHEVCLIRRDTDRLEHESLYQLRAGLRVITGLGASPQGALRAFKPDIVHVHNLFPNFGTRWLGNWSGRLVATLHNFRLVCANGLLFRDQRLCLDCPSGSTAAGVRHGCYHNSRLATLPLAIGSARGAAAHPLVRASQRLIVLSHTAHNYFASFGVDPRQLTVIPNGVEPAKRIAASTSNGRWLAVGRMTEEKGFAELASRWPSGIDLDIIGDGPEAERVSKVAGGNIRLLGQVTHETVREFMADYSGLVFPSLCLEMQPTVVVEAMAAGIPVVTREGTAGADLVIKYQCGRTFNSTESLVAALREADRMRMLFGTSGRNAFEREFTPETWLRRTLDLYAEVVK